MVVVMMKAMLMILYLMMLLIVKREKLMMLVVLVFLEVKKRKARLSLRLFTSKLAVARLLSSSYQSPFARCPAQPKTRT